MTTKIPSDIADRASKYVRQNGRYHKDAPKKPYSVRYPPTASRAFIRKDTWELVEDVAKAMMAEGESKQ